MTMITSSFKEVEQEEQANFLTTLQTSTQNSSSPPVRRIPYVPSLAQSSAESGNAEVEKYYPLSPRTQRHMGSRIYAEQLKNIDEDKVRDFSREIAVYELAKLIGHQANFIKSDPKERRGKFLSSPSSDLSKNLPRTPKKVEAIHPQQQRYQNLRVYLDSLKKEARVTGETEFSERVLNLSWSVWERLTSLFQARGLWLEVPDACPGSKNNFMYTWSKSEYYLECEIFGTGEIEFFYRNRNTGEVWGEDTTLDQGFSGDILDKASLFIE